MNKEKLKRISTLIMKVIGVFFFVLLVGFFSLRGYFLKKAIEKVQVKLESQYQTSFKVGQYGFKGLSGVELHQIEVVPNGKDTLLVLEDFSYSIRFMYALIGDVRVSEIFLRNGYLQLTKRDSVRNIEAFLANKNDTSNSNNPNEIKEVSEPVNYAEVVYKLITKVLNKVPASMVIDNFSIKAEEDEQWVNFKFLKLDYENGQVSSEMQVSSPTDVQNWRLSGMANPNKKEADLLFSTPDSGRIHIPYLAEKFNLTAGFKSAQLQVRNIDFEGEELVISGKASMNSFLLNHPKISSKDVVINNMEFNYAYRIGENFIAIDSTSKIIFNGVVINPFVYFQNGPDTIYKLVVKTEKMEAQQFIDALPAGLFSHIKGMKATGSFSYRLDFYHNENRPDDMIFESSLEKEQFKITQYGEADLGKLNREFMHVPYENGRPSRAFMVGPSNPYFTPLDLISPLLRKTILTTEDPSFYWHRGFVGEAFRQSIAKNIRTGKFKRGASTISMQLVKNVFLTREKTMARKLEEILLVYILENNHIAQKDRMYEVYLNIIEWGPNVYGIGEASQFYFMKAPQALTLSECMFLATIIPSPKKFMWRFGKDGVPRPYLERSYRYLANKMISRQLILPEDTIGLTHLVPIVGPAQKLIVISDTLAMVNDTILEKQLIQIQENEVEGAN
jgi:hypothetical protein